MAYDPQRQHRRPTPADDDPAPVDSILGPATAADPTAEMAAVTPGIGDDPPPVPAVTPEPADPPSDKLLISTGLAGAAAGIVTLLVLRHLWLRRTRRHDDD
jgi:hypothetical protein